MRTAWKVMVIVLLVAILAAAEAFAISEVVKGNGAKLIFVTYRGLPVTWVSLSIDGAVAGVALLVAIVAAAIYRWRVKHGY